jgi:hypothetical protein
MSMNRIEFEITQAWREANGYQGKGGVCIVYDDVCTAWVPELPPANHWVPGSLAVGEEGRAWRATGGDENIGAAQWVLYMSKWRSATPAAPGSRRRNLNGS